MVSHHGCAYDRRWACLAAAPQWMDGALQYDTFQVAQTRLPRPDPLVRRSRSSRVENLAWNHPRRACQASHQRIDGFVPDGTVYQGYRHRHSEGLTLCETGGKALVVALLVVGGCV